MRPRWTTAERPWFGPRWPTPAVGINRVTWEVRLCLLVAALGFAAGALIAEPLVLVGFLPVLLLVVAATRGLFFQPSEECFKQTHIFPRTPK